MIIVMWSGNSLTYDIQLVDTNSSLEGHLNYLGRTLAQYSYIFEGIIRIQFSKHRVGSSMGNDNYSAQEQVSQLLKIFIERVLSLKRVWNTYHLLFYVKREWFKESQFSQYMAIEKAYKCTATLRGFCNVLTQKFLYIQIGKHLRVEICNVASLGHCPHTDLTSSG